MPLPFVHVFASGSTNLRTEGVGGVCLAERGVFLAFIPLSLLVVAIACFSHLVFLVAILPLPPPPRSSPSPSVDLRSHQ